jgi:hypothetical protein
MTQLDGFFSLRSPRDLLKKIEADYDRLQKAEPDSIEAQYAAFDFFVAANHLPDWLHHARGGSLSQHRAYSDGPLVDHIASGAKHFRVMAARHASAKDTRIFGGFWKTGFWAPGVWRRGVWREARLSIELEDGTNVDVLQVAQRVLQHWRSTIP